MNNKFLYQKNPIVYTKDIDLNTYRNIQRFICVCDQCHKEFKTMCVNLIKHTDNILCRYCRLKKTYENYDWSERDKKSRSTKLSRYGNETYVNPDKISRSLSNKSPEEREKIYNKTKNTNIKLYGCHPAQRSEQKELTKHTCLDRYGGNNPMSSDDVKNKMKQNNLKKYGVENPFQSEVIKNKIKETNLEKYGVENPSQSKEIRKKTKQTCLDKYGVEISSQADSVKEKYKQTCLERYDVDSYVKSRIFQDKVKRTNLERYGVEYYTQSEEFQNKFKQTCLERYGVENPFQSEPIRDKTKETNLERYGSEYYTQSQEFQSRHDEIQTKINNTKRLNHTFNSSEIEEIFSDYLDSQHIEYKRQYRSEEYPFNCDFYLPKYNLYIEIQASWTHGGHPYDCDEETDKDILESWKSKNTDYYKAAVETWTMRDIRKRNIAKLNNLNYLEIFSNDIDELIEQFELYIN